MRKTVLFMHTCFMFPIFMQTAMQMHCLGFSFTGTRLETEAVLDGTDCWGGCAAGWGMGSMHCDDWVT